MKIDVPSPTAIESLSINNGEFDIVLDCHSFRAIMERQKRSSEDIAGLWNQFAKFASDVELSRISGFALGSTDPVGALDDQVYRFNLAAGRDLHLPDDDLLAMIKAR